MNRSCLSPCTCTQLHALKKKLIKRTHIVERELPPSWYGTSGLLSSRCTSLLSQPSYFSSFYLDMVKLCCCFGNDISSPTTTSSDLHAFKRIRMNLTSLYSHGIYSELATLLTLRALCHFTLTSTLYVGSSSSRSSLLQFHGGGCETAISLVISLLRSTWICGFYIPSH